MFTHHQRDPYQKITSITPIFDGGNQSGYSVQSRLGWIFFDQVKFTYTDAKAQASHLCRYKIDPTQISHFLTTMNMQSYGSNGAQQTLGTQGLRFFSGNMRSSMPSHRITCTIQSRSTASHGSVIPSFRHRQISSSIFI